MSVLDQIAQWQEVNRRDSQFREIPLNNALVVGGECADYCRYTGRRARTAWVNRYGNARILLDNGVLAAGVFHQPDNQTISIS